MPHGFNDSLAVGKKYEQEQDEYWKKTFHITMPSRSEDRHGVDRHFVAKEYPCVKVDVQYKGDERAGDTGNLFFEFVSVDRTGAPGWAVKCDADWLCIYVPALKDIYVFDVDSFKAEAPLLAHQYTMRECRNDTYVTKGIAVPFSRAKKMRSFMHLQRIGGTCGATNSFDWAQA